MSGRSPCGMRGHTLRCQQVFQMSEHTPIGLENEIRAVKALTHSGNFHADETLGYAILHYALAPEGDLRGRVLGEPGTDRLTLCAPARQTVSQKQISSSMWVASLTRPKVATITT